MTSVGDCMPLPLCTPIIPCTSMAIYTPSHPTSFASVSFSDLKSARVILVDAQAYLQTDLKIWLSPKVRPRTMTVVPICWNARSSSVSLHQAIRLSGRGRMGLSSLAHTRARKETSNCPLSGFGERLSYKSSQNREKLFCARCGSQLFIRRLNATEWTVITHCALNEDSLVRPFRHVFTGSNAPWHQLDPALPAHPTYPEPGDA